MSISVKVFAADWLDNDQAHVVVVQPPPCSDEILKSQASRPSVLATLLELFEGPQKLRQLVTGSRRGVVILPELALAPSDWKRVDEAIRRYQFPVILICGFGVMKGAELTAWLTEAPSITKRDAVWDQTTDPASERVYNGGWCWIHDPKTPHPASRFKN